MKDDVELRGEGAKKIADLLGGAQLLHNMFSPHEYCAEPAVRDLSSLTPSCDFFMNHTKKVYIDMREVRLYFNLGDDAFLRGCG